MDGTNIVKAETRLVSLRFVQVVALKKDEEKLQPAEDLTKIV